MSVTIKIIATIALAALTSIPFDLWLLAYRLLSPDGFIQKAIVLGFGIWIFGFIQLMCVIAFFVACYGVWVKD